VAEQGRCSIRHHYACLLSFSAKFDSFGIASSETAMALNLHQTSHYLTVPID
jgi:hypothetical protein